MHSPAFHSQLWWELGRGDVTHCVGWQIETSQLEMDC